MISKKKEMHAFSWILELSSVKNFGSVSSFYPLESETAFFSSFSANSLYCIIFVE